MIATICAGLGFNAAAQNGFLMEGIRAGVGRMPLSGYNYGAALSGGEYAHVWSEGDLEGRLRINLQIISPLGQPQFDRPPALSSGDNPAVEPEIMPSADGGAVVIWGEMEGERDWRIRVQKIDAQGNALWEEEGKQLQSFDGVVWAYYQFVPANNGGGFIHLHSSNRDHGSYLYSFSADGSVRDGWSEEGMRFDSHNIGLFPTPDGGCWLIDGGNVNRLTEEGGLVWDGGLDIVPPELGMTNYGFGTDGENLFALFSTVSQHDYAFGASVYDLSGGLVAADIIHEGGSDAEYFGVDGGFLVAGDGRVYLTITESFLSGDVAGPVEMPLVVCYAPFEDEVLPFGVEGVRISGDNNGYLLWNPQMLWMGERLIITNAEGASSRLPFRAYALDEEGNEVWEGGWKTVDPTGEGYYGRRQVVTNGNQAWVLASESTYFNCYSFDADGELLTGNRSIYLFYFDVPNSPGFTAGWVNEEGDYTFLGLSQKGLCRQKVGLDGELEYDLGGDLLRAPWSVEPRHDTEFGEVAEHRWLWSELNDSRSKLFVLDDELNIETDTIVTFPGANVDQVGATVFGGDDHLLVKSGHDVSLMRIGLDGSVGEPVSWNSGSIRHLQYWEGHGWLLVNDNGNATEVTLLDENLREVWRQRASLPGRGSSYWAFGFVEGAESVRFARLRNTRETGYWVFLSTITEDGGISGEDSVKLFEREIRNGPDEWTCYPMEDGKFWFHGRQRIGGGLVQGLDSEGRRLIPNDGFAPFRNSLFRATGDGGCWVLWDDIDSIRVTRLGSDGRSWQNAYPPNGLGIYSYDYYRYLGVALDMQTDRLWTTLAHNSKLYGRWSLPEELRIQVFGDEWMDVGEAFIPHPSSLILSCYPNPFNSSTTITFNLPTQGPVHLEVYDPLGRRVKELVGGRWMKAGEHDYSWNTMELPSGIYVLKVGIEGNECREVAAKIK
jgi:hypothetical protein